MPRIVITFQGEHDTRFGCRWNEDGPISESQLEIAGRELLALAERHRAVRLQLQAPLRVAVPEPIPVAPAGPPAPPAPPASTDPAT